MIGNVEHDAEHLVLQFMKRAAMDGHLEPTINEIKDNINSNFSGRAIEDALVRLETRGTIKVRPKGRLKPTKYYHLAEIEAMCKQAWGEEGGQ